MASVGTTAWEHPDVQSYYRNLMDEYREKNGVEAKMLLQRGLAELARGPGISGVQVMRIATGYAAKGLYEPALEAVEAFERACEALAMKPTEADLDQLQAHIDQQMQASVPHVDREIGTLYKRFANMAAPARIAQQVSGNAAREVHRRIERRKLEIRHVPAPVDPRSSSALITAFDNVNRRARKRLGFSLFHTSAYQATQDVVRPVKSRDELAVSLQALALLLDQTNEDIARALEASGITVPEGSINRMEALLASRAVTVSPGSMNVLRDVRRLGNDYPRHPGNRAVEEAAQRLGLKMPLADPSAGWLEILRHTIDALEHLAGALEGAS